MWWVYQFRPGWDRGDVDALSDIYNQSRCMCNSFLEFAVANKHLRGITRYFALG